MNSIKFILLIISLLFITSNCNHNIIYNNYIKNYYNIPSYHLIDDCFKNEFYKKVYNTEHVENNKNYKTKLDQIIIYV